MYVIYEIDMYVCHIRDRHCMYVIYEIDMYVCHI